LLFPDFFVEILCTEGVSGFFGAALASLKKIGKLRSESAVAKTKTRKQKCSTIES